MIGPEDSSGFLRTPGRWAALWLTGADRGEDDQAGANSGTGPLSGTVVLGRGALTGPEVWYPHRANLEAANLEVVG